MSEILVDYVLGASKTDLLALSLEDLALCQAWYASYLDMPTVRERCEALPGRVAAWTSDVDESTQNSNGARQQPLLRYSLDRLSEGKPDSLARDELDFLFFVYELVQRTKQRDQFQRPMSILAPCMPQIRALRESMAPVRGLPAVLKHVGVATEASILAAPRRTISGFGGLPMEFRGPVLRHGETLKVVGDVPDSAAVVVEGDACYVSGYVLGKLLVRGHIEIRNNISGLVIAQRGNIRARAIVNRATVIAKLGRVRVTSSEGPDLVYGGTQIRINERARLGQYMAPRVRVDGTMHGGECHVTTHLKGGMFAHTDHHPMEIIFRKELHGEDYGAIVPREGQLLQRKATRLKNRMEYVQQLMKVQQEEAEHYASTALLYICSGKSSHEELQRTDALKRRRAFLIRMLTGVHLITVSLAERLKAFQQHGADGSNSEVSAERSVQAILNDVSRELAQLKVEGDFPEELDKEWAELMEFHAVSSRNGTEGVLTRAILRFNEARKAWRRELNALDEQVGVLQGNLAQDATRRGLIERAQAEGTSQTTLAQLIRAARLKGAGDPVMQRVATPFIKRMLTLMQKRNQWVERYHKESGEQRAALEEARKRLVEEFGITPTAPSVAVRVEGRFEAGVRLYIGEKQTSDSTNAPGTSLTTPATGDAEWVYGIQDGEIVRIMEN